MGLIQYGIEKAGIPAISITHLAHLTKKVRVSRALQTKFPLGRSFGKAGEVDMQRQVLLDCLHYLKEIKESETIIKLPYKWKGRFEQNEPTYSENWTSKKYSASKSPCHAENPLAYKMDCP